MQTASAKLHKALLDLDSARNQERYLREESDALLEGMNAIISSKNTRKAFTKVLEVLKRLLQCDEAFVLREQDNGILTSVASSSSLFEDLVWSPGAMFKHILAGNPTNVPNISYSTDWQQQPAEIRSNVTSALHASFSTTMEKAMLVCTSSKEGYFNKSHIRLLERFSPLAGQALYNIEINDLYQAEVEKRKQAEESLATAEQKLQNAK